MFNATLCVACKSELVQFRPTLISKLFHFKIHLKFELNKFILFDSKWIRSKLEFLLKFRTDQLLIIDNGLLISTSKFLKDNINQEFYSKTFTKNTSYNFTC